MTSYKSSLASTLFICAHSFICVFVFLGCHTLECGSTITTAHIHRHTFICMCVLYSWDAEHTSVVTQIQSLKAFKMDIFCVGFSVSSFFMLAFCLWKHRSVVPPWIQSLKSFHNGCISCKIFCLIYFSHFACIAFTLLQWNKKWVTLECP